MANWRKIVDNVIYTSDIILLIIDARDTWVSRNRDLEYKIGQLGKKYIYVINKCDLLEEQDVRKIKMPNSIKISATLHSGTVRLLKKIIELSKGKEATVGVVGLPNTGKSSVINALKGRKSAPTSSISGFTKGLQKIRISKNIMMLDTPGVLPWGKRSSDDIELVAIGTRDAGKIKDADMAAALMIERFNGKIEEFFGVEKCEDTYDTLENIALKKKILKKGGEPDAVRMGRRIIELCQRGDIR